MCKIVQLALFRLLHCLLSKGPGPSLNGCKAPELVSGSGPAPITITKIGIKIGESDANHSDINPQRCSSQRRPAAQRQTAIGNWHSNQPFKVQPLALCICLLLAGYNNPVLAQQNSTDAPDQVNNQDVNANKGQVIETITVTAQKRQQNVMDVPVAIDSVSATDLKETNSGVVR